MTQPLSLPLLATVKAAYGDVCNDFFGFLKIIWVILLMMVLFVELPMLMVQREVYYSVHPEKRVEASQIVDASKLDLPSTEKKSSEKAPTDNTTSDVTKDATMEQASRVDPTHVMIMMGLSLLQLLLIFSFSVAWYKQLLFNEKKGSTVFLHFGKLEWNFGLTAMKSGIVLAPIVLVLMSYYMASIPGFAEGEPIHLADYTGLYVGGCVLMLYLVSRLSMSYPLTMMGRYDAPIKESWSMTKHQAGRIMLGFLMMSFPVTIVTMVVVVGASYLINMGAPTLPDGTISKDIETGFAEHLFYKTIGSLYMIFAFALVSAFYARAYAFLVRSQQAPAA